MIAPVSSSTGESGRLCSSRTVLKARAGRKERVSAPQVARPPARCNALCCLDQALLREVRRVGDDDVKGTVQRLRHPLRLVVVIEREVPAAAVALVELQQMAGDGREVVLRA